MLLRFIFECLCHFFCRLTLATCCCPLTPSSPSTSTRRSWDRNTSAKSSRKTHREHTPLTQLHRVLASLHPWLTACVSSSISAASKHLSLVSVLCFSHVYAIADAAFNQSQASTQEQCIIIRYWQELQEPHFIIILHSFIFLVCSHSRFWYFNKKTWKKGGLSL